MGWLTGSAGGSEAARAYRVESPGLERTASGIRCNNSLGNQELRDCAKKD
ncbi:hypothetical protein MGG_15835 [Pyricularia oryzae 70-15]|uniref:Uncharacterized protein n=3 Tax=Pyricularia oryzae TaxID=318829 RepID=G4MZ79_PYRO7|nr:uncharacterized protein MGG_15835 [Pyricularia oryzae 70-15]EHA55352.1 hypothetical protein MGG_15835 [Pyricularia oryzae 70-15]ELQ37170.1 hypothetical protein OOU_Y34scaffold00610g7 [Pyricularia oryzae Y34]